MITDESLRRLKNKVKNELIIYYCLKSYHCFGFETKKLENRMKRMILNIGFLNIGLNIGLIFMWSWFALLVIFTGNLCQGKQRGEKAFNG